MRDENIKEQAEKTYYAQQNANTCGQAQTTGGILGADRPRRETMRERINQHLYRMERDHFKASQMRELTALLDKNPEVARILELVEELGMS